MDKDFIKNRSVHSTTSPVLSFKNYDCEVYNSKYVLGEVGTLVKSTLNEKIGSNQFYNNEPHNVVSINEWTITLRSLDTKAEKIISTLFFQGSHTLPNHKERPNFVKAQMMTAFSIQGKTMDKIAIDLGSFVCSSKKGPVVHLDTLYRGIIVGASRVKTAEDVFFLNYGKLFDKSIRFVDDFIPQAKEWDECMDVNEVVSKSINKDEFLKNLSILDNSNRSLGREKMDKIKTLGVLASSKTENSDYKDEQEFHKNLSILDNSNSTLGREKMDRVKTLGVLAPTKTGSPDHREEQEFVEMVMDEYDHSKGHRQIFMSSLTGRLNKKKKRDELKGYSFDTHWAFDYAQSLVGLEDEKYRGLCKRLDE
jgi:hypothetical protein